MALPLKIKRTKKAYAPPASPIIPAGVWMLVAFWALWAIVCLTVDLFADLYTTHNQITIIWYAVAAALPLAAYTLYLYGREAFEKWYAYILSPLVAILVYTGACYFVALNGDMILSVMFKPAAITELPVASVHKARGGKSNFIHTDVTVRYNGKPLTLQGTRSSYFYLKNKKTIRGKVGISYLGNYYMTRVQLPPGERWAGIGAYFKYGLNQAIWVIAGICFLSFVIYLFNKVFPNAKVKPQSAGMIIKMVLFLVGLVLVFLVLIILIMSRL